MKRAVFLDRDGTVIIDHAYLKDPDGVALLDGAAEALAALQAAGYELVLVTNQSGIGRGYFGLADVHLQHERLRELLAPAGVDFAAIRICPHAPDDGCDCRKPSPSMIIDAARRLDIDCSRSYMVGDKLSDTGAGRAAGCCTILIGSVARDTSVDHVVPDLLRAADVILEA